LKKGDDGNYSLTFNLGKEKLCMVTLADLGFGAARIFSNPDLIGKDVYVCSD
jgi:hypothetical protein